jgi:hypothetical protein
LLLFIGCCLLLPPSPRVLPAPGIEKYPPVPPILRLFLIILEAFFFFD